MDLTQAKALSLFIRLTPLASVFFMGAPAGLLPKIITYGACLKWAEKADQWAFKFGLAEKIYGMRSGNLMDKLFAPLDPQPNVIRCAKLGKLRDGSDINDLRVHFLEQILQYPRFRCNVHKFYELILFREIPDDQQLNDIVQVIPGTMTEQEATQYMEREVNYQFNQTEPLFRMRLVQAKEDDGIYMLYQTHHSLADGLSMLTFLSKAQDGGEAAHAEHGVKYPVRNEPTLQERLGKISEAMNVFQNDMEVANISRPTIVGRNLLSMSDTVKIVTSKKLNIDAIKANSKKYQATFNTFMFAAMTRAVDEHSGGKEVGETLFSSMAVSLYKPEDGGINYQPQNKLTCITMFIDVKQDMDSQVDEQKRLNDSVLNKAVLANFNTIQDVMISKFAFAPWKAFNEEFQKTARNLHLLLSNMQGPRTAKWTYLGGELEYLLIVEPQFGPTTLCCATVGDHCRITMTTNEEFTPDPEGLMRRIERIMEHGE